MVQYAHDLCDFRDYNEEVFAEVSGYYKSLDPLIYHVFVDSFNMLILFKKINPCIFSLLGNARPPHDKMLRTTVFDAIFTALNADVINEIKRQALQEGLAIHDILEIIHNNDVELNVWYFDSIGAKRHDLSISCKPQKKDAVRECIVDTFTRHRIILDFL